MDKENSNDDLGSTSYVCPLCEKIAENPVQNNCGCIYCSKCAEKCVTESIKCPKCDKPLSIGTLSKLSIVKMRVFKTSTMKRKYSCLGISAGEETVIPTTSVSGTIASSLSTITPPTATITNSIVACIASNSGSGSGVESHSEFSDRKRARIEATGNREEVVNLENLLSLPSIKEREDKKISKEILDLLSKPTAKDKLVIEKFQSVGGGQVQEFCPHGTREDCKRVTSLQTCDKLHFKKIIQKHTDESLGDCSFLNTCFHMDSCKYVHYEVDMGTVKSKKDRKEELVPDRRFNDTLRNPQWIQCDLRTFDVSILGKFDVIMADPPWDIHMDLPYGTMSDEEMRQLNIPCLQDKGLLFLWVTGRAMELGRECLELWGYERCDEIIWVKTNQLQRIIRTGRTGHWLNHGKEHCLVGIKGEPENLNRGLDCDVIVAEVRATSHKPDEIYGIIERLSPGTKKIELFGRTHNLQPNWITLGNQLPGVCLHEEQLLTAFAVRYPNRVSELKKLS
ncbi:N6-adenosine-methyltransferase subunit METTL3-like [Panonychus citri]|uniref:N6-adenosine-methyltransferase subunit METTL3-like n=1 Tax=Panonychus citri TaxID=50023 RepID=UPI0023080E46|nr:N6-adenosine-methyltransferase subunit METTL3-like [Panonychus citri]